MLNINNITVYYHSLKALDSVSMELKKGLITALVGANGAGKSTTLSAITGLVPITTGSIELEGQQISGLPPQKIVEYGISLVPEGRRLFPEMTVLENLKLGAFPKRASEEWNETRQIVFTLFPILQERKEQLAGTLSGGEQQMLAIARGLMARPKILLLDEPSLGLAPILVDQMLKTIEKINKEGVTILVVEQNIEKILKIANFAYVIENGQIVISGDGQSLLKDDRIQKAYLGL